MGCKLKAGPKLCSQSNVDVPYTAAWITNLTVHKVLAVINGNTKTTKIKYIQLN